MPTPCTDAPDHASTVRYAVAPSRQREHSPTGDGTRRVGYDVYALVTHATTPTVVYHCLRYLGWVRECTQIEAFLRTQQAPPQEHP